MDLRLLKKALNYGKILSKQALKRGEVCCLTKVLSIDD